MSDGVSGLCDRNGSPRGVGVGITSGLTVSSHPPHAAESVSPHPLGSEVDGGLGRGSVSPDPPPSPTCDLFKARLLYIEY